MSPTEAGHEPPNIASRIEAVRTVEVTACDHNQQNTHAPTHPLRELVDVNASPSYVNVLIMNLPFRVRWQDLKDLCRQACHIERAEVALEIDGRSRGFGEVTCTSRADAESLFRMFDGFEWQNRKLNVILMDELVGPTATSVSNLHPGSTLPVEAGLSVAEIQSGSTLIQPRLPTDNKLLFIGNLPFSMQWQDLKDLLRPAGRVQRTDISISGDGRSRGWGTALFASAEEAQRAVDMFNDTQVDGRSIKVRLDRLGGRGLPTTHYVNASTQRASMPGMAQTSSHPGDYPLQQQYAPPAVFANYSTQASYLPQARGQFRTSMIQAPHYGSGHRQVSAPQSTLLGLPTQQQRPTQQQQQYHQHHHQQQQNQQQYPQQYPQQYQQQYQQQYPLQYQQQYQQRHLTTNTQAEENTVQRARSGQYHYENPDSQNTW